MIVVWWFVIVICSLILFSGLYVWFEGQIYKDHYIPEFETEKKVREIKLRLADIEWRMNKNDESTSSSDNPIRSRADDLRSSLKGRTLQQKGQGQNLRYL